MHTQLGIFLENNCLDIYVFNNTVFNWKRFDYTKHTIVPAQLVIIKERTPTPTVFFRTDKFNWSSRRVVIYI